MMKKLSILLLLFLSVGIANSKMTVIIAGSSGGAPADVTAPEFISSVIAADGDTVTINFSEPLIGTEIDTFNLDCDGVSGADISRRKNKCNKCSYSTKVKSRSMGKIKKCKKVNRMINNLIRDANFKCPIGKF